MNPYSYNTSNELTATPSGSYTFDNNGSTLTDASGKSYTWDFENRMVSAVVPGTGTVTFKYDPLGRRIQKSSPLGTLASVLVANNYDPKLVQELLRHSNIKTTLDIYAQAITSAKLEAGDVPDRTAEGLMGREETGNELRCFAQTLVLWAYCGLAQIEGCRISALKCGGQGRS